MVEVTVKDNIKQFTKQLDNIQKKQIPFATSRAMNDTAVDAQEAVVARIQRVFANKKKWWTKSNRRTGIRVNFSKKNKLKASVFTNAPFASLQEDGGTKTPHRGRVIAVPTGSTPKRFAKSGGAKKMLETNKKSFSSSKGIYRRKGKKGTLQLMFAYIRSATIRPRFGFIDTCTKTVKKRFKVNFEKRLKQALKSTKK
ncbi:MAG: hypothetical protein KUG67_02725 [Proteobacteria bacterium]|nr:hypothetical protein [Pseudomonadota bacterium]